MAEIRRFHGLFETDDIEAQKEVLRTFVKEVRVSFATREVTVYLYPVSRILVGPTGFEPATPCTPCKCSSQAELWPDLQETDLRRSPRGRRAAAAEESGAIIALGAAVARATRAIESVGRSVVE